MALFKAVTFLRLVFSIIGTGSLNYEKCVITSYSIHYTKLYDRSTKLLNVPLVR